MNRYKAGFDISHSMPERMHATVVGRLESSHSEFAREMAGAEGLEPTTTGFGDRCSTN